MRALFIVLLASSVCLAGCGQASDSPMTTLNPAGPTAGIGSGSAAAQSAAAKEVEVPFRSEITWTKVVNGGVPDPCQGLHGNPPAGMIYLMRNTGQGPTNLFVTVLARDPRFHELLERMRLTDVAT